MKGDTVSGAQPDRSSVESSVNSDIPHTAADALPFHDSDSQKASAPTPNINGSSNSYAHGPFTLTRRHQTDGTMESTRPSTMVAYYIQRGEFVTLLINLLEDS
jgi:hypothetical protein